jgi:hypothetical protein
VANTLNLFRGGAVGFIDWLDFGALLPDEFVIKFAFAVRHLAAADRTSLHVAAEDVELAFPDAAIVTRLSVCPPVSLLIAITNAVELLTADAHGALDRVATHDDVNLTRRS